MRISVLTENNPGSFTPAEHGLSYFIEHDGMKILFDTGQSDLYLRNAGKMNVSMDHIDMVVLSHGHFDHGNGLGYHKGHQLICHPGCFVKRYRKHDHTYIGLHNTREELSVMFELFTTTLPHNISDAIIFLGEIPRKTDFESQSTSFILEDGTPDYVMDDSALALVLDKGLFVVTGCGHSGIVNTLEHAKSVTGINNIYGIIGGFHLKEADRQTKETIRYMENNKIKHVFPSHCTELPALAAFYEKFGIRQVRTGDVMKF
jgi:7,8-dihydropterin-6-yl-methyl-4-(beta-D-ribofuranosyl)aminobenzene 5'-phosphate synthase